jgi:pullulanase
MVKMIPPHVVLFRLLSIAIPLVMLGLAPAPAAAKVTMMVEIPTTAGEHELLWAIRQHGKVRAFGSLPSAKPGAVHKILTVGDDGPATIWVTLNRDEHRAAFPSFGDLYQRLDFEIRGGDALLEARQAAWQERRASPGGQVLTIHYHRYDGDYQSAGLWTWDVPDVKRPAEQETFVVGQDRYGAVFQLDTSAYGAPGDRIGLLPRLNGDWQFKDGGDRFWAPEMGLEVYLLQDDNRVFVEPPDTRPRLLGASLETPSEVLVRFTHRLPVRAYSAQRFQVRNEAGTLVPVGTVVGVDPKDGRANAFRLRLRSPLDFVKERFELTVTDYEPVQIALGDVLSDPKRFYDADAVLGAQYAKEATTFCVFAPLAEKVEVVLADRARAGNILATRNLERGEKGIWAARVAGDWLGRFYSYRVKAPGLDPTEEVTDIYAHCTTGLDGRGLIVDLEATDPEGFDPGAYVKLASPVDAIVYEVHVRDFTIAASSGVVHKGKFLGLAEGDTRLPMDSSIRTGLDHLEELGVTHVQLLPVQDFFNDETPDGRYDWGYMPVCFNSPDGWYATVPIGPERIYEFKRAVQALHERGIGVIMDVVYNHAASEAGFEKLVPGYYFRRRADGTLWNGSGCGNEFASERPMARKFMIDSLSYWVREYGVDGFRFDLMGLHDLETMIEIRKALEKINPSVIIYGEPWTGGASGLAHVTGHGEVAGTGVGAFNDGFRDAIKGDRDGGAPGFIQTGDRVDQIRGGIVAAIDGWAKDPVDCVTYCACHDNLTTWDKIVQSAPQVPADLKRRMQRFAGFCVLTSQGVSFLHGGQELCRSKAGSHNSYNQPDPINRIEWNLKRANADVFSYYKGLIALRKAHPAFRLRKADEVRARLKFWHAVPAARCLAYSLDGTELAGESSGTLLVLFNGEHHDQTFTLPPGSWDLLVDADRAGAESLDKVEGTLAVLAHSGAVLSQAAQKKTKKSTAAASKAESKTKPAEATSTTGSTDSKTTSTSARTATAKESEEAEDQDSAAADTEKPSANEPTRQGKSDWQRAKTSKPDAGKK